MCDKQQHNNSFSQFVLNSFGQNVSKMHCRLVLSESGRTHLSSICLALFSTADLLSSTWTIRLSNSHCWSCRAFPICATLNTDKITTATLQKKFTNLFSCHRGGGGNKNNNSKKKSIHFVYPGGMRHYAGDLRGSYCTENITEKESIWILNGYEAVPRVVYADWGW